MGKINFLKDFIFDLAMHKGRTGNFGIGRGISISVFGLALWNKKVWKRLKRQKKKIPHHSTFLPSIKRVFPSSNVSAKQRSFPLQSLQVQMFVENFLFFSFLLSTPLEMVSLINYSFQTKWIRWQWELHQVLYLHFNVSLLFTFPATALDLLWKLADAAT